MTRLLIALLAVTALRAQQNTPHLGYLLPAGGQQGTTVKVIAGGQFLGNTAAVYVSGSGVKAKLGEATRRMNAMEAQEMRDRAQTLQRKQQQLTADERKELADLRLKLVKFNYARFGSPALSETFSLTLDIAADAAPGRYEVRLRSPQGLSNPLVFTVSDQPELVEQEKIEVDPEPPIRITQPRTEMEVPIPAVINGRILPRLGNQQQQARPAQPFTPADADRYRFHATAGEKLVIAAQARDIMPYLADAVPGWFQAVLTLYGPDGKEVAYCDDDQFRPDPVIRFTAPQEGDYTVEIRDALFRGREDFVYRLAIQKAAPTKAPARFPAAPATLKLPATVSGRIAHPGDSAVFHFNGRAGATVVAEVNARRSGSPLDSLLELIGPNGKRVALNDDFEDPAAGLVTHHADSYLSVKLPATGAYTLRLSDTQHQGGPDYTYRLRVGPPHPDFDLIVSPSSINIPVGLSVPITVHAIRRDGFSGAIALTLEGAPPGFRLSGATIPEGVDEIRITLTPPPQVRPAMEPFTLKVEGRSGNITHPAQPAENMMQAFAYYHLVPSLEAKVAMRNGAPRLAPIQQPATKTLQIPTGGSVPLPAMAIEAIRYELSEPPEGVSLRDGAIQCDPKVKPGGKGNLLIQISSERTQDGRTQRTPLGFLPAMPFEIVAR